MAYRIIGQHHFPEAPESVFRIVRPQDYDQERQMRDESKLLEEHVWPKIDFDELTALLGRPPEQW